MALSRDEDKPWKTDLARKSAQRREQVLHEVEEVIKKAPSFEEALRQSVELMKKRFGRYSAITAYVADGEDCLLYATRNSQLYRAVREALSKRPSKYSAHT